MEPGEEEAGTDVGLEQEAQVFEGTLPLYDSGTL
jgi:hypothetical protein